MLLAAGRGERLRPLTDHQPKPLISVGGQPLIVWQLQRLHRAGIREVVVNLAHLGEQLTAFLGNGSAWGMSILYSQEPPGALETAGGIRQALSLLGPAPFVLANADVWTDYDYSLLPSAPRGMAELVLVPNPAHHPRGDFALVGQSVRNTGDAQWTYAGIGVFRPALFTSLTPGERAPLAPLLRRAIEADQITGQLHRGSWIDVGTVERLRDADRAANSV